MANDIRLSTRRFGPRETIRATYEPESNQDVLAWKLFSTEDPRFEIIPKPVKVTPAQKVYEFVVSDLPPGSYHLQVYSVDLTPPTTLAARKKWDHENRTPDDEQVFEVFDVPQSEPLRVALTREKNAAESLYGEPLGTFKGFEEFLVEKGTQPDGDNPWEGKDGSEFATFSDENYEQLKNLARRYVRSVELKSLSQLARPYILGRMEDEPALPPEFYKPIERFFPAVELIWNFWQESGMVVQTLNLILARFQNRVVGGRYAPLDRFDVTPLASLHALLYAFVDDEQHRMTVRRRAAEYEYEYGLKLIGKAIPPASAIVERRSSFLETFHQVLYQAHVFFKEDDDLTVNADPFPLFRTLRDCHLELSGGSHNQYGQLAVAARAEFLTMQYLLARPEMKMFLGGKPMTPYPERWMDGVDRMKEIQSGWPAASIMHFHDLAEIGERLVLTIRLGSWADSGTDAEDARKWVVAFRQPIQRYVAAYRSVTGVDLSRAPDATQPATLIWQRAQEQRLRA